MSKRADLGILAQLAEGVGEEAAGAMAHDAEASSHDGAKAQTGDTGDSDEGRSRAVRATAGAAVVAQELRDLVGRQEHGNRARGLPCNCALSIGVSITLWRNGRAVEIRQTSDGTDRSLVKQ